MKKQKFIFLSVIVFISTILSLLIYGIFIEPYHIEIHHVWIQDSKLERVLHGKTVVQISDLHIKRIGDREKKVLQILDELKPDFIFLTGDYVQWNGDYKASLTFLSRLKAKVGIWAVMGDYDYSRSRKSCLFCHEEGSAEPTRYHSVRFLRDSVEQVTLSNGTLWVGGMDFERGHSHKPQQFTCFMENGRISIWT